MKKGCQRQFPQKGRHRKESGPAAICGGACWETAFSGGLIGRGSIFCRLARFGGGGRRFEYKGEKNDILVVDDYGHHPVEIAATLATARTAYPDRRVVVAFQPHRFSRTQALFGEFCHVLGTVDKLLLTEIYPASEKPIPGVNGQNLAQGIRQVSDADVSYFQNFDEMVAALPDILKPGDLFLTIGAGNVTTVGPRFLALE